MPVARNFSRGGGRHKFQKTKIFFRPTMLQLQKGQIRDSKRKTRFLTYHSLKFIKFALCLLSLKCIKEAICIKTKQLN